MSSRACSSKVDLLALRVSRDQQHQAAQWFVHKAGGQISLKGGTL
jgi:hypothetical protein